jgi:outer membrane assembly lipoprotein YfiO
MIPFLFLACIAITVCAESLTDTSIDTIISSAHIPQDTPAYDTSDNEPFIIPSTMTMSPVAPTNHELQKIALREQFRQDLPEQKEALERHKDFQKKWPKAKSSTRPNLTMNDMNFMQLVQRKNELILEGDYKLAIKYLERTLKIIENADQPIFIMLELAELLMKTEQYAKAEKVFTEFIQLYPGNEYVEQAFVKAIRCSWEQTGTFDRDQTKTEETIALISRFESRQAICSTVNIASVAEIKSFCEQKLAASNMYVAKHYIKRGIHRSAHKRLDDIRQKDLCKIPQIEPELLMLEIELAQAEKNTSVETTKFQELCAKYPTHEITLTLAPTIKLPEAQTMLA